MFLKQIFARQAKRRGQICQFQEHQISKGQLSDRTSNIHPGISLGRALWAVPVTRKFSPIPIGLNWFVNDSVSPRMNTIALSDQFKPIRIGENLLVRNKNTVNLEEIAFSMNNNFTSSVIKEYFTIEQKQQDYNTRKLEKAMEDENTHNKFVQRGIDSLACEQAAGWVQCKSTIVERGKPRAFQTSLFRAKRLALAGSLFGSQAIAIACFSFAIY